MSEWKDIPTKYINYFIIISFAIALLLNSIPTNPHYFFWLPDWVAILLLFWSINRPDKVGFITAFILGIILDIIYIAPLGAHALSYCIAIYIVFLKYRQINIYSYGGQSLIIGLLLFLIQFIISISELIFYKHTQWEYFLSPIVAVLLWPIFNKLMLKVFNNKLINR